MNELMNGLAILFLDGISDTAWEPRKNSAE